MFLFNSNKRVLAKLDDFFASNTACLNLFSDAMDHLLDNGIDEPFLQYVAKTHSQESHADDIRREIEIVLYKKALLPESRRDILRMVELTDQIANRSESILNQIETQQVLIPDFLHAHIREEIRISVDCVDALVKAATGVLGRMKTADMQELINKIDEFESECDLLEQKMIRELFKSDLPLAEKLLIKEIVLQVGGITDYCENTADFLTIFHIKRQV
jgi:predicted phosphate transport protein (TIGR00153 family)